MHSPAQRDEKTLFIGTALGLFCVVVAIGALTLWAATSVLELGDTTVSSLGWVIAAFAGLASFVYLLRARQSS